MLNTILCVDDDPITLMLCKKVIAKTAFSNEIITMSNGEEALTFLMSLKTDSDLPIPELIFLDLNMPVMGGWEFLDILEIDDFFISKNIKVIVLSSTIDPEDLEKSKQYKTILEFLPKPITRDMLTYLSTKKW